LRPGLLFGAKANDHWNLCDQCGVALEYKTKADRVWFALGLAERRPDSRLAYITGG